MERSGHWLVPQLFGKLYADKPPIAEWLTAIFFRVFGERELAGRLPHLLLAASCPLLLFAIARRVGKSARAAVVVALSLATSLLFLATCRLLLTDEALLAGDLAVILALVCVGWRAGLVGAAALGWSLLAKGPVAALGPGLFAIGRFLGARDGRKLRRDLSILAAGIALAIPWFVAAGMATGGESARAFLLEENLGRFLHVREGHAGAGLLGLTVFLFGLLPWSGFLARLGSGDGLGKETSWGLRAWALGIVIFFSASATTLPHYFLPALPPLLLLTVGRSGAVTIREERVIAWTAALGGCALLGGALAAVVRAPPADSFLGGLLPVALLAASFLAIPLLPVRIAIHLRVLGAGLLGSAVLAAGLPRALNEARALPRLGTTARRARLPGEPIGGFRVKEPVFFYYAETETRRVWKSVSDIMESAEKSSTGSALVVLTSTDAAAMARKAFVAVIDRGFNAIEDGPRDGLVLCRIRLRAVRILPAAKIGAAAALTTAALPPYSSRAATIISVSGPRKRTRRACHDAP
jgi:4-amino-4-deoxy-L-arabinose transferase-like glycosyltransferase